MKLPILLITGLMLFYPAAGFAQSVEGVQSFSQPEGFLRSSGTGILILPDKYAPVMEFLFFMISRALPTATTSPPCSPAPGPISTI